MKKKTKRKLDIQDTFYHEFASRDLGFNEVSGKTLKTVSKRTLLFFQILIFLIICIIFGRLWYLQILNHQKYINISENNVFEREILFAPRGDILDRNGEKLAWNTDDEYKSYSMRNYLGEAFGSLMGYVRYPSKDKNGNLIRGDLEGVNGIEHKYDSQLNGLNGALVRERNVSNEIIQLSHLETPIRGIDVQLTIDKNVQQALHDAIRLTALEKQYLSGAGVVLKSDTGEIFAAASYPNYDSNVLSNGNTKEKNVYLTEADNGIFLNRALFGLFTPGSTLKPFFALASLREKLLKPEKIITSTGSITINHAYDKEIVYTYRDWKAHGPIDLYQAIAFSSNVYFFYLGGGYKNFEGLGIDKLNLYADIFGFKQSTNIFSEDPPGNFPSPEWKLARYDEVWNVGDTYNTVIGQYSVQLTPLQLARAMSIIASGGVYKEPYLHKNDPLRKSKVEKKLIFSEENIDVVRKGMRLAVLEGPLAAINYSDVKIAGKTGTAQIGQTGRVNTLVVGFWPYENPKYTFVLILEDGPEKSYPGLLSSRFFENLRKLAPEYISLD